MVAVKHEETIRCNRCNKLATIASGLKGFLPPIVKFCPFCGIKDLFIERKTKESDAIGFALGFELNRRKK